MALQTNGKKVIKVIGGIGLTDLFNDEFDYEKEWEGMPEFIAEDLKAIASVTVNFLTVEDMNAFSELIGRRITFQTKSILFPIKESVKKVYIDES
jgi:hypothetical protein